jgi:predicted secreted protein
LKKDIGDEFKLVFESNPSTGYHWEIIGGLDSKIVELVQQYYQSNSEVTLVGGGGVDIWVFRAVGAGTTTITVGYFPPSNGASEPEKTETFTLIVARNQ